MRKTIFELPTIFTVSKVLRITGLQRFEFGDEFFGLASSIMATVWVSAGLVSSMERILTHVSA